MVHKTKIVGLTLLISALCMQSTYSYKHVARNDTDGKVLAIYRYLSCDSDSVIINPGKTVTTESGGCCINGPIEFIKQTGTNIRRGSLFHVPKTGFGIACRGTDIKIVSRPDGIQALPL